MSAIKRRMEKEKSSPEAKIHQGLALLNNPDVYNNLPHDVYMGAAESLLRAKHFGQGGGYDKNPQKYQVKEKDPRQYNMSDTIQMDNGGWE